MLKGVLKEELIAIRDKYGDDRRTEIMDVEDDLDIEDLIEEEECVFTLTQGGYLKRTPVSAYRTQRRGGKGVNAQTLKEEDYVKRLFTASTHDFILFFTNIGKVHRVKGYRVPEDVQIIGFDGIRRFGRENESLFVSSICQPVRQLAAKCVELVLAEDRADVPSLTLLPVRYEYGGTTKKEQEK